MKGKYLITTDNWFYAPDGCKYKAAWGEVDILKDSILGVQTNRNSTNWYVRIGSEERGVIIAGCQVHYAVRCKGKPDDGPVIESQYDQRDYKEFLRRSEIYIAE